MKITCDCGEVLYDQPIPAPGPTPGGDFLTRTLAIHVDVRVAVPGETQLLIQCTKCRRIFIQVEHPAPVGQPS